MRSLASWLVAAVAVAFLSVAPAQAQQACQFTIADATASMDEKGTQYIVLDEKERALFLEGLRKAVEEKTGQPFTMPPVTNVLMADIGGELYFGLEINGCLTPPEPVAAYLPDVQQSGATPFGVFS